MTAHHSKQPHKGFTLLELTIAMLVGTLIAAATLAMFNNQLLMFSKLKEQNFIIHKAPTINNLLTRIIPQADQFHMYPDLSSLKFDHAIIADAKVIALKFQNTYGVISFNPNTKTLDYFSNVSMDSDQAPKIEDTSKPSWQIANHVEDATFFVDQTGIIRITITGPNEEEITFSTTTQN